MYELNVHNICMSIILFDIANKNFWKAWKKSEKIIKFQNENLVATLSGKKLQKKLVTFAISLQT